MLRDVNYYDVLGIPRDFVVIFPDPLRELKKIYFIKAKSASSVEELSQLQHAYQTLSNRESRSLYNAAFCSGSSDGCGEKKNAASSIENPFYKAIEANNLEEVIALIKQKNEKEWHVYEALGNTPLRKAIHKRFTLECISFTGRRKEVSAGSLKNSKGILDNLFDAYMKTFEERCAVLSSSYDLSVVRCAIKNEFSQLNTLPISNIPNASEKLDKLYAFELILRDALTLVSSNDDAEKAYAIEEIKEFIANEEIKEFIAKKSKYCYRMVGVLCMLIGVALFVAGIPLPAILTFNYVIGASSVTAVGASLFYYGQDTKLVKTLSAWMRAESVNNKIISNNMNPQMSLEFK
jgi:hypothetical protein